MITATTLHKSFGDIHAVNGVSFEIPRGETFGLLGPNGAGKSTTINMIVGITTPDSGSISIDGEPDPTRPSVRLKIGNSPQALALYDSLTAEENLNFFGSLYGLTGATRKQRVQKMLELAGLTDRRNSQVGTFSGGMKRRLNLACAVLHDPPALLFDEPTVGVDPQSRSAIFETIEQLRADGRTIVYTTHYMEEAQRLCSRVAIVDHGRILALDTVDNLIRDHGGASTVVAELAETPPANHSLPGVLDGRSLRVETNEPFAVVGRLATSGVTFTAIDIRRADLERVFLNLTGRRLRDQ